MTREYHPNSKRIGQWRNSFVYESKRMGFSMEHCDRHGSQWYELGFQGDNLEMTTENDYVKVPVVKAAQSLWGLPRMSLTTLELFTILEAAK